MKNLLKIFLVAFTSLPLIGYTYSPTLLLLENKENSQKYLDQKSKKRVAKNIIQVMIYDKYSSPYSDDFADNFQSSITKTLIDCKYKVVAVGGVTYYKGRTSNSERVGRYDDTFIVNTVTGGGENTYEGLPYNPINNSLISRKIYDFACNK